MKTKILIAAFAAFLVQHAHGAAAGYVNVQFAPGDNWFANPLQFDGPGGGNSNPISQLIYNPPDGTTVRLWDSSLGQWGKPVPFFTSSGWDQDLSLTPGMGVLLNTPTQFTNTFVGIVLNFDGSPWNGRFRPPPPFSGPAGTYFLSSRTPVNLPGPVDNDYFDVFEAILGRAPRNGERFTRLDPQTQMFSTTTFIAGAWDNGEPTLRVAEAGMLDLLAVPEPCSAALLALFVSIRMLNRGRRVSDRQRVRCSAGPLDNGT